MHATAFCGYHLQCPGMTRLNRRFSAQARLIWSMALFLGLVACTSLGHQGRAAPKIAKATEPFTEIGFDGDDNDLSIALEKLLEERGIKVRILSTPQVREQRGDKEYTFEEVQTRYVLQVRSEDLDRCVPEGSRQMNFNVSVIDFKERSRVFLMTGHHGCQNTLVNAFGQWLSGLSGPPLGFSTLDP